MGCVNTKGDINDTHPNVFEVTNVDDMGNPITPGQLELTEMELILYQRGKSATHWPLRCLRKYGFDSEIFSFESGRRCPTGAGIYAFQCRKAEQLFNMLQQNIQVRNINLDNNISPNVAGDFPPGLGSRIAPLVQRQVPFQTEGYLNPTPTPVSIPSNHNLSRPSSVSSNGPTSPATPPVLSPPPDIIFEHNNNKQGNLVPLSDHSVTNQDDTVETDPISLPVYMNLEVALQPKMDAMTETYSNLLIENNSHLYMNVDTEPQCSILNTKDMPNILPSTTETDYSVDTKPNYVLDLEEIKHCYANIDAADLEGLRSTFNPSVDSLLVPSLPDTPTYITVQEVNYAELDLVPGKNDNSSLPITPDSPTKPNKSYVTIDFKKTNALSQTVNPGIEVEEGSRKTRHNSTISDIPTRHSNSLSD